MIRAQNFASVVYYANNAQLRPLVGVYTLMRAQSQIRYHSYLYRYI
jgi:hypothetical protein